MLTFEHPMMDFTGQGASRRFAEVPEQCPVCRHHIDPRRLTAHSTSPEDTRADFSFQCPRAECRRVFVGEYRVGPDGEMDLVGVSPRAAGEPIPEEVRVFAPAFVELYGQAREAEARGLHRLAALGLREALAALVRELVALEHPDEVEESRRMALAERIRRYVPDPLVRACAERTGCLDPQERDGSEDVEPRELETMKLLVRLTVNWLDSVLLARSHSFDLAGMM